MKKKKLIIMLAVVIFIIVTLLPASRVKDRVLRRNVNYYSFLIPDEFDIDENAIPIDRKSAWNSELPFFIKKDIEYARKNNCDIEYSYKNKTIHIDCTSKENTFAYVNDEDSSYFYDEITNFSIYKNKNGIVLYGYENNGKWFGRIEVDDGSSYMSMLTYDINMPLDKNSMSTVEVGDYSLCIRVEDGDCVSYYYKNAELISRIPFTKKVKKYSIQTGTIITEANEIYQVLVNLNDYENPIVEYAYVDKMECDISDAVLSTDAWKYMLPIFIKDEDYYTICPEDWETYKKRSLGSSERSGIYTPLNCNMKLVKIVDCFESAEFTYSDSSIWNDPFDSNLIFNINGVRFKAHYKINGYDSDTVELEQQELEKYCKTVYSLDEFWDNIYDIRAAYEDKYLKRKPQN